VKRTTALAVGGVKVASAVTQTMRAGELPRPVRVLAASTSRPVVRKAHGTAVANVTVAATEPRITGLFQTVAATVTLATIAVLEQPSSRGVRWYVLGRRNIVPSQSDELNHPREQREGNRVGGTTQLPVRTCTRWRFGHAEATEGD